jgi:hypothetical protein
MTFVAVLSWMSAFGPKQTSLVAFHTSASDPKRTSLADVILIGLPRALPEYFPTPAPT